MCSGFHLLTPGVGFLHAAWSREREGGRRWGGMGEWKGRWGGDFICDANLKNLLRSKQETFVDFRICFHQEYFAYFLCDFFIFVFLEFWIRTCSFFTPKLIFYNQQLLKLINDEKTTFIKPNPPCPIITHGPPTDFFLLTHSNS